MGFYDLDNPGRAGFEVAKYDGWNICNIINAFLTDEYDLTKEYDRNLMRKAMLVSNEYRMVSNGVRFGV